MPGMKDHYDSKRRQPKQSYVGPGIRSDTPCTCHTKVVRHPKSTVRCWAQTHRKGSPLRKGTA